MTEATGDILAWGMAGAFTLLFLALLVWGFRLPKKGRRLTIAECYLCYSNKKELRPYGVNKQLICLSCLKSSPETKAEASKQFAELLDGHDGVSVIDGAGAPRKAEGAERQMLKYYGLMK